MRATLILLALVATSTAAEELPTFSPAHWVEGDDLEPAYHSHSFRALSFPTPDEGWIVGDQYILHIRGEQLEVAFLELHDALDSVSFVDSSLGWLGGNGPDRGRFPLLRYRAGVWNQEHFEGMRWPYWRIRLVTAGSETDAWAVASVSDIPFQYLGPNRPGSVMLRYEGADWAADSAVLTPHPDVRINDACRTPDKTWWFIGHQATSPSGLHAWMAYWDGSALQRVSVPEGDAKRSALSSIRCASDGTVWALGDRRQSAEQSNEILLIRRVTTWERLVVPADLSGDVVPTSLAAIGANEVWVSAHSDVFQADGRERYLHLRDGVWETVELPVLPGGRSKNVRIVDTQFVSPTVGWAIAQDLEHRSGGARIYHCRDGVWRNRNWNWHFWDAPGFGLFGY